METNETQETVQETPLSELNIYGDQPVVAPSVENTPSTDMGTVADLTPTAEDKPVVTEKIVEKIVEKYPEFKDDYSKTLYESILEGKDDELFNYLAEKKRDYTTMSDVDVVKLAMKKDNPTWGDRYIDAEFKTKYGANLTPKDLDSIDPEMEPEKYEAAKEFNEALELKETLLNQAAIDARIALEAKKQTLELPKIQREEVQTEKPLTQEEIDELNRKWDAQVENDLQGLSEFKFKVGDEEVVYKVTDEERTAKIAYLKDYQPEKLALERGWINADGSENPLKLAEDLLKLENFEKILASTKTQFKTDATKEVVAEIKNLNLNPTETSALPASKSLGDLIWGQ